MPPSSVKETEYYDLFGVSPDATEQEIKRAYKKKSLQLHPDRPNGDSEKFKEITNAYKVLSDPDTRKKYDQFGKDGISGNSFSSESDLFSFFSSMFGGGGPFTGSGFSHRRPKKTQNTEYTLNLNLTDLFHGVSKKFRVKRKVLCKKCKGTGSKSKKSPICPTCKGQGQVTKLGTMGPGLMVQRTEHCDKCCGSGKCADPGDKCEHCKSGKVNKSEEIKVDVKCGAEEDEHIVFEGMADEECDCKTGDFVVTIKQNKDKDFTRIGNDLILEQEITLDEALHGFVLKVKNLKNEKEPISVCFGKCVIKPGDVKRVSNLGMPIGESISKRGDLFIKFDVKFPKWEEANKNKGKENEVFGNGKGKENVFLAEKETYSQESLEEYIESINRKKRRNHGGFGFSFF